jgi:hypothetical protein
VEQFCNLKLRSGFYQGIFLWDCKDSVSGGLELPGVFEPTVNKAAERIFGTKSQEKDYRKPKEMFFDS